VQAISPRSTGRQLDVDLQDNRCTRWRLKIIMQRKDEQGDARFERLVDHETRHKAHPQRENDR
jgi:hypothetical protein